MRVPGEIQRGFANPLCVVFKRGLSRGKIEIPLDPVFSLLVLFSLLTGQKRENEHIPSTSQGGQNALPSGRNNPVFSDGFQSPFGDHPPSTFGGLTPPDGGFPSASGGLTPGPLGGLSLRPPGGIISMEVSI